MDVKLGYAAETALDRTEHGSDLGEELLLWLCNGLSDLFSGKDVSDEERSSFERLASHAKAYRAYGETQRELERFAFDMGAIWGMAGIYDAWSNASKREEALFNRLAVMRNHDELLGIVQDNPGITHKELAKRYGKTPSRLTQIAYTLTQHQLLSSSKHGRTKHYYLTTDAIRLREEERKVTLTLPAVQPERQVGNSIPVRKTEIWEFFMVQNEVYLDAKTLGQSNQRNRMLQLMTEGRVAPGARVHPHHSIARISEAARRIITN